jgi:hypothetical protein
VTNYLLGLSLAYKPHSAGGNVLRDIIDHHSRLILSQSVRVTFFHARCYNRSQFNTRFPLQVFGILAFFVLFFLDSI